MEEKDILNPNLTMEFDNLIEEYVVKEKNSYSNNFLKTIKAKSLNNQPPNLIPPNMPPRPPYPEFNYAVFLSRRVYWQLATLIDLYENLRSYNLNPTTFNNLISQTELLRVTMYNIYRRLSGNNLIFGAKDNIPLTGDFCSDLQTTYNYLTELNTNLFYLQRLVDINDINRQLIISLTVITNQLNTLNSFIKEYC